MESLHRQVLPFLLRRLKDDVLQDLPPKIIQDYYCDLSPLQVWCPYAFVFIFCLPVSVIPANQCLPLSLRNCPMCVCGQVQLYEDFAKTRARKSVDESLSIGEEADSDKQQQPGTEKASFHIFQVYSTVFWRVLPLYAWKCFELLYLCSAVKSFSHMTRYIHFMWHTWC